MHTCELYAFKVQRYLFFVTNTSLMIENMKKKSKSLDCNYFLLTFVANGCQRQEGIIYSEKWS